MLVILFAVALTGHFDISVREIHPHEVQQLLRVPLVGVWDRLVSGLIFSRHDSNFDDPQSGRKRRDPLAGQWQSY